MHKLFIIILILIVIAGMVFLGYKAVSNNDSDNKENNETRTIDITPQPIHILISFIVGLIVAGLLYFQS